MHYEMFPEEVIALQQELKNHPKIIEKLQNTYTKHNAEWGESLGIIAAELGILLDGVYDPLDLCRMLLRKLKEKSTLIVRPDPSLIPVRIVESGDSVTISSAVEQPKKPQ